MRDFITLHDSNTTVAIHPYETHLSVHPEVPDAACEGREFKGRGGALWGVDHHWVSQTAQLQGTSTVEDVGGLRVSVGSSWVIVGGLQGMGSPGEGMGGS